MIRAVLEGVCFGLRDGLELMIEAGLPRPQRIRASGGGLVSPLWRQILADVMEAQIELPRTTEGAAYGAAVLASVGGGWFDSVQDACTAMVSVSTAAVPGPERAKYAELYPAYRELYPALRRWFHRAD